MRLLKRIMAHSATQAAVAGIAALYVRLVDVTTRWDWRGFEAADRLAAARRGCIVCFWHGRLLMMPQCRRGLFRQLPVPPPRVSYAAMISAHRDGQLIARCLARLGVDTIVGSSSRGGLHAMLDSLARLADGSILVIAPDGPRGPRMRAAAGPIHIARRAGVPILPAAVSVSRRRLLSSWDRFQLPLPFGRGVFLLGEPLNIRSEVDPQAVEAARLELERRLNLLTAEADRLMGHGPVEPAPEERPVSAVGAH